MTNAAACGPEKIVLAPDGQAWTICGCGANLAPGDLYAHLTGESACRVCWDPRCDGVCEADEMRAAADPEPEWRHDY